MDKTSTYIMAIVAIVALVGAVYMISLPGTASSNGITGNVVSSEQFDSQPSEPKDHSGTWRTLLGLTLVGACVFMYHREF